MENREYIDISFSYDDGMAIYPANPQFVCQKVSDMQKGDSYNFTMMHGTFQQTVDTIR